SLSGDGTTERACRLGSARTAAIVDNPVRNQLFEDDARPCIEHRREYRRGSPSVAPIRLPRSRTPIRWQFLKPMPAPRIPRTVTHGKPEPKLQRRAQHLAFVRQLPCVACGKAAPSDAAHVRTGTDGGVGIKPGDRYAVPLCTTCHTKQHRVGELTFWSALRFDPLNVAFRLWTVSPDLEAGQRTVFRVRQHITLAKAYC